MLLTRLFRFLAGFVKFSARGGFRERFVNLCDLGGVKVRALTFEGGALEGFVAASDYKKLRPIAKKSGMTLACVSKHGLPFFAFKNRHRVGLLIGAGFFAAFMSIMSLFVWSVDTTGSERLSRTELLSVAAELGVKSGAFRPGIDVGFVADSMITRLNGRLVWAAVNISGSRAVIEVRDFIPRAEDKTFREPCNIVADFDGLLLSLEVHNGTKANSEGNGVKKGDLLISGIVENRDLSSSFREARGRITALHSDSLAVTASSEDELRRYTFEERVLSLRLFHLKIPLGFFRGKGEAERFESEKALAFGGVELPIALLETTAAYYEPTSGAPKNELERAADAFTAAALEKYKNTRVLGSELTVSRRGGAVTVSAKSECIDFMGEKQRLEIDVSE